MDRDILLQKLKEKKYTHEQLVGWVTAMPANTAKRKPTEYRAGVLENRQKKKEAKQKTVEVKPKRKGIEK